MTKGPLKYSRRAQKRSPQSEVITAEDEAKLSIAKEEYKLRKHSSIKAAAKAHDILPLYYTLRRRVLGITLPKREAHLSQQLLTQAEKSVLIEWMQYLALTGHPLNKRTVRPKIQAILKAKGSQYVDEKHPSGTWLRRFTKENAAKLKTGRGSGLDPKRAQAFNFTTVNHHFSLFKETIETNKIPWRNIYNMDEKGVQMGGGRKGTRTKYFFSREDKMQYKLQSDDLQLVTIIDIVCADGTADIGPGFVFPGTKKCEEWFEEESINYCVATSENGWTDDEIGYEWFKQVFVPQATERNQKMTEEEMHERRVAAAAEENSQVLAAAAEEISDPPPILLLYDGHGSHTTFSWITLARSVNVILFCLPPHTTHRLQPLDVGCFGPLQTAWFNRCDEILDETGEGMEMADVVNEYFKARRKAFKPENISQAWRKSGLRPLNPDIFTAADFAPSHSSSTKTHAPLSFPSKMPHVPDASSDDSFFDPSLLNPHPADLNKEVITIEDSESSSSSDEDFVLMDVDSSDSEGCDNPGDKPGSEERDLLILETPGRGMYFDINHGMHFNTVHTFESDQEDENDTINTPSASPIVLCRSQTPPSTLMSTAGPYSPLYTRSQRRSNIGANLHAHSSSVSPSVDDNNHTDGDIGIRKLEKELAFMRAQRDAAETHAIMSQRECAVWKFRFNKKSQKAEKRSRRIHTSARVVTNNDGLEEAAENHKKRKEKEQQEADKQARKKEKQSTDLIRRAVEGSTRIFGGSLSSKNKTELEDIADALKLPINGVKSVLIFRISDHFTRFPRLKEDPRFVGLKLERGARGRKKPAAGAEGVDENEPAVAIPASQQLHLPQSVQVLGSVSNTFSVQPIASSSRVQIEDTSYQPHFYFEQPPNY